jgi:hypothetical protein
MFIDAEEIENNLWACGKLPGQMKDEDMDTKEQREEDEQDKSEMHILIVHDKHENPSISNPQHFNDWEANFCINFVGDFQGFSDGKGDQELEKQNCHSSENEKDQIIFEETSLDNSDFVQEFGYDQSNEEHAIVLSHQIAQNFIINDNDYEYIYSFSLYLELFQADDSKFIDRYDISLKVSNCVCYDKITASRFNENQTIHMQPFFHEFHEMKFFGIEVLKSLNNQPIYDKYKYYEEHISTSTHMEFYNSDLLYDNFEIKFQESNKEDILTSHGSPYRITVEEHILLPFILK